MRVGFVVPNFGGGGAEFVAREWATYLQREGLHVVIMMTHPRAEDLGDVGLRTILVQAGGVFARILRLNRVIRSERFDAVISLMPYFNLLSLLASLPIPRRKRPAVIISGRNVDGPLRRLFGAKYGLVQLLARVLYRKADAFVAISHPVAAEAIAVYKVDPQRTYVVLNPALAKVERAGSEREVHDLVQGFAAGQDRGPVNIVVPARVVAQKRPMLAIDVAAILGERGRDVRVVFFGDGPLSAAVCSYGERRGVGVDMRGWVADWFLHCPANSVVLLPSLAEGFGNVLVEAAAMGIPSVASSRCLGAADALVNGITGTLTMGDGATDYASAVEASLGMRVTAGPWLERFRTQRSGSDLQKVLSDCVPGMQPRIEIA